MSEIRVTNILGENGSDPVGLSTGFTVGPTSGTTATITHEGQASFTGICTATAFVPTEGQLSHRNKLINGAMTISQRGTSETGVNSSGYKNAPDRWTHQIDSINSAFTVSQSTDSPDGFANSYKIDITTADTSLGAGHVHFFRQKIEGQNLQDFAFGTSSAKQLTVSFYVKTNKTGTYICELFNIGGNKQVSKTYTVSNTNWNRYTLTFPADTTTAITNDNANRFHVAFWLSSGSNYTSGTLNSSAFATNVQANRAVGQVNLHDSTSNDWYLTGVQLEVGPVATPFEHKNFREQLSDCQRYFFNIKGNNNAFMGLAAFANSTSTARFSIYFPVPMRTNPTYTGSGNLRFDSNSDSADFAASSMTIANGTSAYILNTGGISSVCLEMASTSNMQNNSGGGCIFKSNPTTLNFSAEL